MSSLRGSEREDGQKRRFGQRKPRRKELPRIEFLEQRQLLTSDPIPGPIWHPTDPTNLLDAQNGPMANLGAATVGVYAAFLSNGGNTSELASEFPKIEFQNGMVGLEVKSLGGDFSQFQTELTDVGMQITTASSYYGLVDGYAPVNALPTIAEMAQTQSGQVQYYPLVASADYQGEAYNEAETSMYADVARTEFNVDGTGVTIGVLSTSVNQFNGGLSESYGTGDLNANNPVDVIQDMPAGSSDPELYDDEGRAMLENIYDDAPGANLAFATGTDGELDMANNIEALQKAGAQIEVDDIGYADDPMFQDGIIAQAIDTVVGDGVTYFSCAGNEGPDSGYLSNFRAATGTISGLGTGTFMNFNPSGGTNLELPITTGIANATITFQYDQPYQFDEPVGATGTVTSNVDIYVINASTGAVVVGASQNQNNVAAQQPWQYITIPSAGNYYVAVQVLSGADPGHIEFKGFNDTNGAVTVNTEYGSAGGTSYPSVWGGHNSAAATIEVGATPWWAPSPYLGQDPLQNEPFSSTGPALTVFNIDGVPLSSPQTIDDPTITAPDGGNTSFFGQIVFTNNPEPGEPATQTNLSQNLPSFFGTSSAAPNAAAVAALMLQKVPSLTPAEIRQDLTESATPMNGQTAGTYDVLDGYGLVNAVDALNAIVLRVASTNPASGSTVTIAPNAITVTFNQPVNFATVSAADLTFTSLPLGISVILGTPIAVNNATDPTVVEFPFSLVRSGGVSTANGAYTISVQNPPALKVDSEYGLSLEASGPISFTVADTTSPTITGTSVSGRTVSITFSKALNPATVNLQDILVVRQGSATTWPPTAATLSQYTNLNSDSRTTISYNPTTFTVTLNYSALPQSELPSDKYAIVVLSPATATSAGVTDLVGNPLFGSYSGSFPTGVGETTPQDFIQNLGLQSLVAPVITTLVMSGNSSQNTNITDPTFVGQVYAPFPGTVAGLTVYVEFANSTNQGNLTLAVGTGGRGYTGVPLSELQVVTTNAQGVFTVTAAGLPQGFQSVVAVVVGQADSPPLPGLASSFSDYFRVDQTAPQITSASFVEGGSSLPLPNSPEPNVTPVSSLTTLTLTVVDEINQTYSALVTPTTVIFSALNASTADNISNYSLINTSDNDENESSYISSATFVTQAPTLNATGTYITAYNGYINITFAPGLPAGNYTFVAHTTELQYPGITDAAGNPLNDTASPPGLATKDFVVNFDVQPQAAYITSMALESTYSSSGATVIGTEQSYFEIPPTGGTNTRDNVPAPPTAIVIDFSSPLPYSSSSGTPINYAQDVQLIGSANGPGDPSDGDFGNLGQGGLGSTGSGFTIVSGTTVTLYSFNGTTWVPATTGGSGTRLVLTVATPLTADDYELYIPNQVEPGNINTKIFDVYGNQLDGENVGTQTSQTSPNFNNANAPATIPEYEDLQSSGTYRMDDMSGDGIAGGAFVAAFTVANYGNVVYAQPGYYENPFEPSTFSNGSMANPYPVLAPEGDPSTAPSNPGHDPNGGLNSSIFFQPQNFNSAYDFSGDGSFEQSALYAASQLTYASAYSAGGPVIVVALAGVPQRNPITGLITEASFVLQAPAGNNSGVTNGSTSVPFNTTLVFAAGSTLKLENAALYVQNQGSALQADGTTNDPVTFTSYNNASVGGATNNNPDTTPQPGDWGGLVFRNYDQAAQPSVTFPVDGTLVGLNGADAISGASDLMSLLNNFNISYAGGAVPQGTSTFLSAISLYDAAPTISNGNVSDTGSMSGGTEAAIAADFDSFLEEDATPDGPLIRGVTVQNNNLNGLWLISESDGYIEPTTAMTYPTNPSTLGGAENYNFFEPLPFIVLAQLAVGREFEVNSGGLTKLTPDRLYIEPGVMMKFNQGSALDVLDPGNLLSNGTSTPGASLNVGSRSYITGYDANNDYGPGSAGFVDESASDPTVLFTSLFDDTATTTLVPNPINVTNESAAQSAAKLGPAAWGDVNIISGAIAVINAATFIYGGGEINSPKGALLSQSVLAFLTGTGGANGNLAGDISVLGTHAYITNNNFYDNFDAAMQIDPNGLLAGNTLTPLAPVDFVDAFDTDNVGGGHPFFRGNVMENNGTDGLAVVTDRTEIVGGASANYQLIGPTETYDPGGVVDPSYVNQTVDTVWDATDLTYVLRGTVILAGAYDFEEVQENSTDTGLTIGYPDAPVPNLTAYTTETPPALSLTIQAALPGTELANGEIIPSPGQSVIVKLLNSYTPNDSGPTSLSSTDGSTGVGATQNAGAGFIVGVDDDVDPPTPGEDLVDPGAYSEIRILGIPGNQSTGQQRVPVIITSLRDDTVGTTVRGVVMDDILNSDPVYQEATPGISLTTPAAGDGGVIYIGGLSLTEYDPTDPFDGSLISNADISYMTRIEVQGGGIVDSVNTDPATPGAPTLTNTDWENVLTGYLAPVTQINQAMMFTIADSNLSWFSDAAVFVHPAAGNALYRDWTGLTSTANPPLPARGGLDGEPVDLYMYNDTISNSNQGVHINSETGDDTSGDSPYQAILLNNTFYNDTYAIQTIAPQSDGSNSDATVVSLIMDNIIVGSSQVGIDISGQDAGSDIEYNLFNANTTNILQNAPYVIPNIGATYGNPDFVGPVGSGDASAQDFELQPDSPAINAARSEIGPDLAGNAIYPATTFVNYSGAGGVLVADRTNPASTPYPQEPGRDDGLAEFAGELFGNGFYGDITDTSQIVTLPGSGFFDFPDEWAPVLTTDPSGYATPFQADGTYDYAPIDGQRDILGYIRAPQAGSTGTGYGSNPFLDVGAYQYVNLNPPQVTGVTETPTEGATPVNLYSVGGISGVDQTPWTINITFNGPISASTLNATTVQLVDLGANPAQPLDEDINLSGKISYDSSTDTLVINLASAGLTLGTDAYQITLLGSGSPVITNLQGVALDGENTVGDSSTGAQLALPSGNGYPGGNFYDSFIINTVPPAVAAGTLELDPTSDTGVPGENITKTGLPAFVGTISEPNPDLVPVSGQTVIVNIGIDINGTTYFSSTGAPAQYDQFIRPDAGTAVSGTGGTFLVTVGIDAANTGLVTQTSALPNLFGTYNVGTSGDLAPLPGTDSGYYVAQVIVIDQSGNQSNPSSANAQVPFVVDNTAPTATITSPTLGQVLQSVSGGVLSFTITTDKNIDIADLSAASIVVTSAGPDGILGDADDVNIPINPASFTVTYLDKGTGGTGAERISFSTLAGTAITNDLYSVTLVNTGAGAVSDLAGNPLASPVTETFAVDDNALAQNLFVEEGANASAATGSREDPYATIGAAMAAAVAGDVIAVLPGVYEEQVTMKPFVRLLSASTSSTDSTVFTTSTGDALSTIIRAPYEATAPAGTYATITADGLESFSGLVTEIAGFTIASPLVSNPASGTINANSVAVDITNSDITLDKDYVIDAGVGVEVTTSGTSALMPNIYNDGIIGNTVGLLIADAGGTAASTSPAQVINNDFNFNTIGLLLSNSATTPLQAYVASNIFWENHDQTNARTGFAIYSQNLGMVKLQNNMFYGNGASDTNQVNATDNLGNGFSPTLLGTTAGAAVSDEGNFVGNPAFVSPIDPRPGSDGPANFFIDADYDLTSISAAIDNAWEATAIPTDFLGNSQVYINGGFGIAGYGPRDVGAFEYGGTGGQAIGGAFRVVTTSLVPIAGETYAGGATEIVSTSPTSVTVTFSGSVNPADISATDLVLSGSAINPSSPVRATSLTWIDAYTVEFNLQGQFNSSGTVNVAIAPNSVESASGVANAGYSDYVALKIVPVAAPTQPTSPVATVTTSPTPAAAPSPALAPKGPLHHAKKHAVVHHPKKPAVKHVIKHVVVKKNEHKPKVKKDEKTK